MFLQLLAKIKVKVFLCIAFGLIFTIWSLTIFCNNQPSTVTVNPAPAPREFESQNYRLNNTTKSFSDIFGMDDVLGRVKILNLI